MVVYRLLPEQHLVQPVDQIERHDSVRSLLHRQMAGDGFDRTVYRVSLPSFGSPRPETQNGSLAATPSFETERVVG